MNYSFCFAALLFTVNGFSRSTERYLIQYDPAQLRIAGRSLPMGIVTFSGNGASSATKGFLHGKDAWSKYELEVDGGYFSNGEIKILGTQTYKRSDSITVKVYKRKWFLGGKDIWLLTQKIPYDYEDSIHILTTGNLGRAPGGHLQFGV